MEQLKPCPFCGVPVYLTEDSHITGKHKENCFFMRLARDEKCDLNTLKETWNTREG